MEERDPRLAAIVPPDAVVETLLEGLGITEGIVWHPRESCLLFSDLSSATVHRWTERDGLTVVRRPSNIANGNALDREGRIVSCEHATSCVSRIEAGGRWVRVLASHHEGQALNSPNDVVVDGLGRIWFTDPDYGRTSPRVGILRPCELPFQGVFRLDPDGALVLVAADLEKPNGLCLTPDERHLLVVDTVRSHVRRFAIAADGGLSGGAVLATIAGEGAGKPDGIKVDRAGRVFVTGPGGVHVLTPEGERLGVIGTPDHTRNLCFGDADGRTLYLAVHERICRIRTSTTGVLQRVG